MINDINHIKEKHNELADIVKTLIVELIQIKDAITGLEIENIGLKNRISFLEYDGCDYDD